MLGSYVCRQCRARLNPRIAPSRIPQWQPRATFISLRNQRPQNGTEQTQAEGQSAEQSADVNAVQSNDQSASYNLFDRSQTGQQAQPQRVGRYSRHLSKGADDATEPSSVVQPDKSAITEDRVRSYAPRIASLLRHGTVEQAWGQFERIYTSADCEALTNPSALDIEMISQGRFFGNVLSAVVKAFLEGQGEPSITPTTVLFKYEQLGIANPGLWVKVALEPLTQQVILANNGLNKELQRDLPSLLFELLSLWRLFFQCKGNGNDTLEAISPDWNLPDAEALPQTHQSLDFNFRFQEYHPKTVGSSTLGFCAVYLFNLSSAFNANDSLQQQAAPFLQLLERLLAGARVNSVLKHTAFSKAFALLPSDVQARVREEVESAPGKALSLIGQKSTDSQVESAEFATTDFESFNLKTIARAVEARSSFAELDRNWKRIERDYTGADGKITIPPRIYNAFLSGYLVLRQPKRSVEVWNHMIANGVKPELQTWVAMLEGCEKARDLDGFNAMWNRMQNAGFEPDDYAWTTRVHGLMSLRQIDLALRTLDDMGNRWKSAETIKNAPPSNSRNAKGAKSMPTSAKLINNCTKPSVEVVNGAISAIVQLPLRDMRQDKRVEMVQKILRWGTQFEIKPDTVTFNTLIQLYLRAGEHKTAFKILKQMESSGIKADISTHSMLITAAFDNRAFDGLSEADQASRLIQLFEDIEAGGLRLNNYVYATSIDRLLKQYGSHNAVRTVMDHMRSRNLAPSAHVYTSLITFYFQQDPPAIEAVDSLISQMFEGRQADSDAVLFDRTLEGYAEHGEVGKMMSVLTRMSKRGNHPSFQALTAVIRALVQAGDADRARFIVRDVEQGKGVASWGIKGNINGQKQFLAVAQSLGVGLDEERMGDMFKMRDEDLRKEAMMLDEQINEQIKIRAQKEHDEFDRTPAPATADLEPPVEDIHGFLENEPQR